MSCSKSVDEHFQYSEDVGLADAGFVGHSAAAAGLLRVVGAWE